MSQKTPFQPTPYRSSRLRPGQDIIMRKQAAQFPAVGMTLSSYQQAAAKASPYQKSRPTPAVPALQARPKSRGRIRRAWGVVSLKRVVIVLAVLMLLVGGWVGGKFIYNTHKIFGGSILGVLSSTKLKGESSGRVNILLAGNSADDVGHSGADLTDSIMIMSVDIKHNKAFLLSVPRDLWVAIPGVGHQKINDAYVVGQSNGFSANGFAAGGMGQLEQIIQQNMGITLNYYALIDYNAFKQSVDAVGGIDITIASSDPRGLYDPSIDYATRGPLVRLTNGLHHLNGEQALDLARARGDAYGSYGFAGSDFDRTNHQRQMLVALKSKAVTAGVLANPAKLSSLSDAIGNNLKTDLSLSEVHRLYDLMKSISGNDIQSLSLNSANGKNLLANYTAPDGESTLIPAAGVDDYSAIRAFIAQQTSNNPLVQESASIVILNATNTSGIASKERTTLTAKNLTISAIGDATATQPTSTIIDNSAGKKSATRQLLGQLFGQHFTTVNPYANIYQADFIILLGNDQLPATTTTAGGH